MDFLPGDSSTQKACGIPQGVLGVSRPSHVRNDRLETRRKTTVVVTNDLFIVARVGVARVGQVKAVHPRPGDGHAILSSPRRESNMCPPSCTVELIDAARPVVRHSVTTKVAQIIGNRGGGLATNHGR